MLSYDRNLIGFVDAGFLRAEGAKVIDANSAGVRPNAAAVVDWLRNLASDRNQPFLRANWYDGAFDPSHARYLGQRRFFDYIAQTPGIQLRLGHVSERPSKLERPIRRAIRNAANELSVPPDAFLAQFARSWTFRPERRQKGVDTLIALDMVRLAGHSAYSTALLIAGDRDLAEVVRAVQDFGAKALIATPNRASVAKELAQLADELIVIDTDDIRKMLPLRPSSP